MAIPITKSRNPRGRGLPLPSQESVKNTIEIGVFDRLRRLISHIVSDVNPYVEMFRETAKNLLLTCKISWLSFVAGAEILKRYLLT